MSVHQTVAARLASVDQRYTGGRRDLVELLAAAGRPVSIPEILERRARLPQSSVYRNLAVLESAGAVRRVLGVDEFTRYELAEDLTEHHHHLVCRRCGSVSDFPSSTRFERTLARAVEEAAGATGFVPDSHRLDLVGTCASCASAGMGVAGSTRKNVGHG